MCHVYDVKIYHVLHTASKPPSVNSDKPLLLDAMCCSRYINARWYSRDW